MKHIKNRTEQTKKINHVFQISDLILIKFMSQSIKYGHIIMEKKYII